MTVHQCLKIDELAAYIAGGCSIVDLAELDTHLDSCEPCRREVAAAVRASRTATSECDRSDDDVLIGTAVGRYVVSKVFGSGATAHVYRARDPDLDREVALKLVRHSVARSDERVLREGRALARLAHPNVVAVYDVGAWHGGIFLAMELIDGATAREWARERSWREIVGMFAAVARGLAAAHAAGLVHRDVKPDNLVIGSDGRARVIDFGLAVDLTEPDGTIGGTPAYMAPEQRTGRQIDARCDQYALGRSLAEQLDRGARPARWLRAAIDRATRQDPAQRFPSMADFAGALDRGLRARGRLALAAAALASLTIAVTLAAGSAHRAPACDDGGSRVATVWNPAQRATLLAGFARTGKAFAGTAAQRVTATLDRDAAAQATMRNDACRATRDGRQSAQLLDQRMACLDARLGELAAVIGVLASGDAGVVQRSLATVEAVGAVETCADTAALLATEAEPPNPAERERITALRGDLARLKAYRRAGILAQETSFSSQLLASARAVGYRPVLAEALLETGLTRIDAADRVGAEAMLQEAVRVADESHLDRVRADAQVRLVFVIGHSGKRIAEGLELAKLAAATTRRIGGSPRLEARLAYFGALLEHDQTHLVEAIAGYRHARELFEKVQPVPSEITYVDTDLGRALSDAGDNVGAEAAFDRATAMVERRYGAFHPDVAKAYLNKGIAELTHGRFENALTVLRDAARIYEATLGADHPDTAAAYASIGAALDKLGRGPEAIAMTRKAFEVRLRALGGEAELTLTIETVLGVGLHERAQDGEALEHFQHAAAGKAKLLGADHIEVAQVHAFEGMALHALGRDREAAPILEAALAIEDKVLGVHNPRTEFTADTLGRVYVALGEPACGVLLLERAYAMRPEDPAYVAELEAQLVAARRAAVGTRCAR